MTQDGIYDHPLYTFIPIIRHKLKLQVKHYLQQHYFHPIQQFLANNGSNGVLVLDQRGISLIDSFFTNKELSEFKLLLKESITDERERHFDMFAVYFCLPTTDNLCFIAQDFGWQQQHKILTLEQVKEVRSQTSCCISQNPHFNPYRYKGIFLMFLEPPNSHVQQLIKETNLVYLLPDVQKFHVTNLCFTMPEDRLILFDRPEIFHLLYKSIEGKYQNLTVSQMSVADSVFQTGAYLDNVFKILGMKPEIRHQKFGDLAGARVASAMTCHEVSDCWLFIIERSFDPLAMIGLSGFYGNILSDLVEVSAQNKEDELGNNQASMAIRAMNTFEGYKAVHAAGKQLHEIQILLDPNARSALITLQSDDQSVTLSKPNAADVASLCAIRTQINEQMKALLEANKALSQKQAHINFVKNFLSIYSGELRKVNFTGRLNHFTNIMNTPVKSDTLADFVCGQEGLSQNIKVRIILMLAFMAKLNNALANERSIISQLVANRQFDIINQEQVLILLKNYQNYMTRYGDHQNNYFQLLKAVATQKEVFAEQYTITMLEALILSIKQDSSLVDKLFGKVQASQLQFETKPPSHHTKQNEIKASRQQHLQQTELGRQLIAELEAKELQNLASKRKVFFYIIGGCTSAEITVCQKHSLECQPKLGVFNQGYQDSPHEFVIISDQHLSASKWMKKLQ